MFNKILVALDGSDHAKEAARLAIGMASACGSQLILFHAVPAHPLQTHFSAMSNEAAEDIYRRLGHERADEIIAKVAEDAEQAGITDIVRVVADGGPARSIVKTAKDKSVDVIVVGTRGLTGIHEIAVGSVAHKVTITAPCPVLVVK